MRFATRTFLWTYAVDVAGPVQFTVSGSGTDQNSGSPVSLPSATSNVVTVSTAAFLQAADSDNDHDLGLFQIGAQATDSPAGRTAVGLYHLAWEVASIHELAAGRRTLEALGALVGQSDHGATKSLYGRDPDGNEFEVMWMVPRAQWGEYEHSAPVAPLDIEAEVARHG